MASEPSIPGNADDIVRLQRQIAELQAQLAARQQGDADHPAPAVDTGGGAVVAGALNAGGNFIGRDFVQVINRIVHRGEDPGEANAVIAHYLAALAGAQDARFAPSARPARRTDR